MAYFHCDASCRKVNNIGFLLDKNSTSIDKTQKISDKLVAHFKAISKTNIFINSLKCHQQN